MSLDFKPIAKKTIAFMDPPEARIEELRNTDLPEGVAGEIAKERLLQLASVAEKQFGPINSVDQTVLESSAFVEMLGKEMLGIISSIEKKAKQFPPNRIADCGVSEAAFSHALDRKPIVATDALATCVGVAGYVKESQRGFVIHFATEDDLEASKEILTETIQQLTQGHVVELHLRGGIAHASEPLVEAIEKWVEESLSPMRIVSKQVCVEKELVSAELKAPNIMSLSLDTRDGTISEYDRSTNPFVKKKAEIKSEAQLNELLSQTFIKCSLRQPRIKVVYSSLKK